jgi:hypothetical protein
MRAAASDRRFIGMPRSQPTLEDDMPRYMVQRTFPDGLHIPVNGEGAELCGGVIERNAYVSDDKTRSFCVYDAPTPEAIRKTAARNQLPVCQITQVRVLDPYFYA